MTETLTNHGAGFPDGVGETNFPGIPISAAAIRSIDDTNPYCPARTPSGDKIDVTNSGVSNVSVLDPSTDTITDHVGGGLYPHGIALSPDGKQAYVANTGPGGSTMLSVLDTASNKVHTEIASAQSVGIAVV